MRPNRPFGWIVIAALSFGLVPVAFGQSCREDLNGDGVVDSPDLALLLAAWGPCLVSIDSFTPPQGASLGGTTLTITGFGVGTATGPTAPGGVPPEYAAEELPEFTDEPAEAHAAEAEPAQVTA